MQSPSAKTGPHAIVTFGFYDRESPWYHSVKSAYEGGGSTILECHTSARGFFAKIRDLKTQWSTVKDQADALLVTHPGQYLMPLAWRLTRSPRKKLILDCIVPLYDSVVTDRRLLSPWNPRAWWLWMIDWTSLHLADEVIADTEANRQFLIKTFHLKPERVRVIYLETRHDLFFTKPPPTIQPSNHLFQVLFYGSYIPLQGIDYILQAAKILQDSHANVHFALVGGGQTFPQMKALAESLNLTNVEFQKTVPLALLPDLIRSADLGLGIFGKGDKTQRVIPHKVVDTIACGVPVLTADTLAIRERFADHPLVHVCNAADPEAIAKEIKKIEESVSP